MLDGKHGHQNQVLGLADRLSAATPAVVCPVDMSTTRRRLQAWYGSCTTLSGRPDVPDLVIGAGHRTHLPLVLLRWRLRTKTAVLMKPSLPFGWFDFCLVPSVHQLAAPPANVIETRGVLNRVQPSATARKHQAIILVGGPSSHYRWDSTQVRRQIQAIVSGSDHPWIVATSRRTPAEFLDSLRTVAGDVRLVPPEATDAGWLPRQLAAAETAWVTEDSVSMMYEALTSGARVGVIELERHRSNRVTECTDSLVRDGDITRWTDWKQTGHLPPPAVAIWEAERCARKILRRLALPPARASTDEASAA